jgi:hypothetical protein
LVVQQADPPSGVRIIDYEGIFEGPTDDEHPASYWVARRLRD